MSASTAAALSSPEKACSKAASISFGMLILISSIGRLALLCRTLSLHDDQHKPSRHLGIRPGNLRAPKRAEVPGLVEIGLVRGHQYRGLLQRHRMIEGCRAGW